MKTASGSMGFSLVEVVIALGICVFCLVALLGLFSVGMKSRQESAESIEAANLASLLIAQRRAFPVGSNAPAFPVLPSLSESTNNRNAPIYLTGAGEVVAVEQAAFRLLFLVETNTLAVSQLSLTLSAPAAADPGRARTRFDVLTYVRLP